MNRIIDFHTHVFPHKIAGRAVAQMYEYSKIPYRIEGDAADLCRAMRRSNVEMSVNLPVCTNPEKADTLNDFAVKVAESPHIVSFGCVHPEQENWRDSIRGFRARGLIGLKLHNDYQGFFFDSKQCLDIISAAYEEGLMVLVHAGADPVSRDVVRCTPKMIRDAMPLLRQGTFIAAHLGGHLMLDEAMKYVIGSDVYIDTSMAPIYYSDLRCREAILAHDPDRILFGSDSPWDSAGTGAAILHSMKLGSELEEKILYGNGKRLLAEAGVALTAQAEGSAS